MTIAKDSILNTHIYMTLCRECSVEMSLGYDVNLGKQIHSMFIQPYEFENTMYTTGKQR